MLEEDEEDAAAAARDLLAALGGFWTITGNHPRIFTIADAAEAVLADWDPPDELRTTARLRRGQRATVLAGGLRDTYGNTNAARSTTVRR